MSKFKLYPPVREGLKEVLYKVLVDKKALDQSLRHAFHTHPKWGSKDRKAVAGLLYDIVRLHPEIMAFAKIESIKALTHETVGQLIDVYNDDSFVRNTEFLNYSEEFKNKYDQVLLRSLDCEGPIFLRVNNLTNGEKQFTDMLEKFEVEYKKAEIPFCFQILKREDYKKIEKFQHKYFEIQDINSQNLVHMLNVVPDDVILDACAGNGGKTIQMAHLMRNKGEIIACDIYAEKLERLFKRAMDAGVRIVKTVASPDAKVILSFKNKFDKVLLDVPCSGLGVIRRHPERKWQVDQKNIDEIALVQKGILELYKDTVKVGGVILYSTCTFTKEENENQVNEFLKNNSQFELVKQQLFLTHQNEGDTFFGAVLKRLK